MPFCPSAASTAFPVFDQPDLKARLTLKMYVPKFGDSAREWQVVTNSKLREASGSISEDFHPLTGEAINVKYEAGFDFEETKPISTYVFAFAAGPWERVSDAGVSSPHVSKGGTPAGVNVGPPTRTPPPDVVAPPPPAALPTRSAEHQ